MKYPFAVICILLFGFEFSSSITRAVVDAPAAVNLNMVEVVYFGIVTVLIAVFYIITGVRILRVMSVASDKAARRVRSVDI
jgi:hypothetical protein